MEDAMQNAMTALCAVAGLTCSIAIALLVEELVVGGMFRLLFARAHAHNTEPRQGDTLCC
jgi:hypothetical protein